MARVSYVQPTDASPEVRKIYDEKFKGQPHNVQKALAHQPRVLDAFATFYGSIGRSLERRLYELIYIRVSIINGCQY